MNYWAMMGSNWASDNGRDLCENTGHICPQWTDWDIYDDLKHLDDLDGQDRAYQYWQRCHSVDCCISMKRGDIGPTVKVRCYPNDITGCDWCDYTNEKVAKDLEKEMTPLFENMNF